MILVLAGTQDGREIAAGLREAGYEVIASVVSEYGRELVAQSGVPVQAAAMNEQELQQFVIQHGIRLMIDATHPYADAVSTNITINDFARYTNFLEKASDRERPIKAQKTVFDEDL